MGERHAFDAAERAKAAEVVDLLLDGSGSHQLADVVEQAVALGLRRVTVSQVIVDDLVHGHLDLADGYRLVRTRRGLGGRSGPAL